MILSNVNIGTGPSAGDGDPLRSAFATINTNFQIVTNNVNSLTNSVTSVAGRTGNVILTITDIVGLNTTYATQANLTAANVAMKGYVDYNILANISAVVNAAPTVLDTIRELADAIGDDPHFATNVALSVSTANTSMKGYVDGQISAANSSVTSANIGLKGYVDQANSIQSSQISAANVGIKGYIDQGNTIQSSQISAANVGMIGYVNQANTTMKSYVDGQITAANTHASGGNTTIIANNIALSSNVSVLGGNITLSFNYGWNRVTLTESVTGVNFANVPSSGQVSSMTVEFVQDSAGGHTVDDSTYLTVNGVGLDISTVANATSLVSFITSDGGTKIFGISAGKNWI